MSRTRALVLVGVVLVGLFWSQSAGVLALQSAGPSLLASEPGISPDGREIAFAAGGDLWTVPAVGGEARLLVSHEATERRPLYSPDGSKLAFMSTRTGGGDIYVLTFSTGALQRLTKGDGLEALEGWSADGRWVYFASTAHDVAGMNDIYRVAAAGGTPMLVTDDRYVNEFGATASPDGSQLVIAARGIANSQWWRRGSSHIDQSELWLLSGLDQDTPTYTLLSERDSRQVWPLWASDGRSVLYVSDRGGAENLWRRDLPGPTDAALAEARGRQVTQFADGRLLFPTLAANGRTVAFERDFAIWTMDTTSNAATRVPITFRGAVATPVPERRRQTNGFSDLALSPDGKKVAFTSRGILFAASAKDAGDATRVTTEPGLVSQPVWAPDSRRLVYVAAREGTQRLYLYDFVANTERALTTSAGVDLSPVFSPDGTQLAFLRDRRELRVLTMASGEERVLASGMFADAIDTPVPVWSPSGEWIAAFMIGSKSFTNVYLIPTTANGGPPRAISGLANVFTNTIAWSPDGATVFFDTRQRTEDGQLIRVELTLKTPKFREDLFRDLFIQNPRPNPTTTGASAAAGAPAAPAERAASTSPTPIFDDIRRRLSVVPMGLDVQSVTVSPDGKLALVAASAAGQTNLYTYPLDELATDRPVARQLTTTSGNKSDAQFSPDGKEVYYLEGSRIQIATVERRESRSLNVAAEYSTDFATEKMEVFRQAWTLLRDNFYDPEFHGVNWEASRETYGPRVTATQTPDEMRRVMSLMIGDLNASHLGISGGGGGGGSVVGRLGLRFDRRGFETQGRLRVTEVVALGPAAVTQEVKVGDFVRRVAGVDVAPGFDLDEVLSHTIDRRVVLGVSDTADGAIREVAVKPVSTGDEKGLLYRQWVERNREYVLKVSGGRFGYVHMASMGAGALDQLYLDLDVENHERDGVVIDLRNNNGGFVNAYALDVFARQPYLRMSLRGLPDSPARTVLGQRALELPTILVINQHSLSDAEDFTEGYRALKLGAVVGEPTAGWIIYTWNRTLLDGSSLRLPRMRVRAVDGSDMELVPRPVDLELTNPLGEWKGTGQDTQLFQAVRELVRRLGIVE
jgi:Tol biopolymer transport system component/C-terminal processing protease CtpA/Prc